MKIWFGWLLKSLYTVTHSTSTWIPRCNLQLARISILLKDSSSSSAGVQHPKEQRTDPFEEPEQQFAHVGSSLSFFIPKGLQTMGAFSWWSAATHKCVSTHYYAYEAPQHTQISLRKTRGVVPYNEYTAQLLFCPSWWCIARVTINRGTIHFMSSTVCIRCCVKNW